MSTSPCIPPLWPTELPVTLHRSATPMMLADGCVVNLGLRLQERFEALETEPYKIPYTLTKKKMLLLVLWRNRATELLAQFCTKGTLTQQRKTVRLRNNCANVHLRNYAKEHMCNCKLCKQLCTFNYL